MLDVQAVTKRRGRRMLWGSLSFRVACGEQLAITGPSGSGKSTLLDCIGQIDSVDSGCVTVDGVDGATDRRTARLLRRDVLGYLFQDFGLVPDLSVETNVRIAVARRGRRLGLEVAGALERVGLSGLARRRAHELSGGEQQRVALARLIVKAPRLILADEPTSALDDVNARVVLDVLGDFADGGAAVVVATHSDAVSSSMDRQLHLTLPDG